MTEAIGTALARVAKGTAATASPGQSTSRWDDVDLDTLTGLSNLPERLDDRQLAAVDAIASLPAPPLVPTTETHFLRCMRMLNVLPSRDADDLTSELRLALYRRHFGHLPEAAWSFLVERATLTCRFFPSPAECAAILDRWSRTDGPHRAHQLAMQRVIKEREARFTDAMSRLRRGEMTQAEADALPERWRRIAMTRGLLWEGTGQLRASGAVRDE